MASWWVERISPRWKDGAGLGLAAWQRQRFVMGSLASLGHAQQPEGPSPGLCRLSFSAGPLRAVPAEGFDGCFSWEHRRSSCRASLHSDVECGLVPTALHKVKKLKRNWYWSESSGHSSAWNSSRIQLVSLTRRTWSNTKETLTGRTSSQASRPR